MQKEANTMWHLAEMHP